MTSSGSGQHRGAPAWETHLAVAVAILGVISGVAGIVSGVQQSTSAAAQAESAEVQARAAQAEADTLKSQLAAQPGAEVLVVDGHRTKIGGGPYSVAHRPATLEYRFTAGNTGEEPVIVVHPLSGSRAYYPLRPGLHTPKCSADRTVRCASINIGAVGDVGAQFTIAISAVPPQITREVNAALDAADAGGPRAQWGDLPVELATPLTNVAVLRIS